MVLRNFNKCSVCFVNELFAFYAGRNEISNVLFPFCSLSMYEHSKDNFKITDVLGLSNFCHLSLKLSIRFYYCIWNASFRARLFVHFFK